MYVHSHNKNLPPYPSSLQLTSLANCEGKQMEELMFVSHPGPRLLRICIGTDSTANFCGISKNINCKGKLHALHVANSRKLIVPGEITLEKKVLLRTARKYCEASRKQRKKIGPHTNSEQADLESSLQIERPQKER